MQGETGDRAVITENNLEGSVTISTTLQDVDGNGLVTIVVAGLQPEQMKSILLHVSSVSITASTTPTTLL